jgi:hypothetical protein
MSLEIPPIVAQEFTAFLFDFSDGMKYVRLSYFLSKKRKSYENKSVYRTYKT